MNQLVKVVNNATDVAAKEIKKSTKDGSVEVSTKMDSLYNVFFKIALESEVVQEFVSINTEPWVRNLQIPPTAIDVGSKDVNTSLQQLQNISLDINVLSTQTLVHLQRVSNQELVYR